jgi:hypothetical protein
VVQLVKSTRDFEIFGAQPWHDSTELAEVRQGERSTELTPKSPKIQKPQ